MYRCASLVLQDWFTRWKTILYQFLDLVHEQSGWNLHVDCISGTDSVVSLSRILVSDLFTCDARKRGFMHDRECLNFAHHCNKLYLDGVDEPDAGNVNANKFSKSIDPQSVRATIHRSGVPLSVIIIQNNHRPQPMIDPKSTGLTQFILIIT